MCFFLLRPTIFHVLTDRKFWFSYYILTFLRKNRTHTNNIKREKKETKIQWNGKTEKIKIEQTSREIRKLLAFSLTFGITLYSFMALFNHHIQTMYAVDVCMSVNKSTEIHINNIQVVVTWFVHKVRLRMTAGELLIKPLAFCII